MIATIVLQAFMWAALCGKCRAANTDTDPGPTSSNLTGLHATIPISIYQSITRSDGSVVIGGVVNPSTGHSPGSQSSFVTSPVRVSLPSSVFQELATAAPVAGVLIGIDQLAQLQSSTSHSGNELDSFSKSSSYATSTSQGIPFSVSSAPGIASPTNGQQSSGQVSAIASTGITQLVNTTLETVFTTLITTTSAEQLVVLTSTGTGIESTEIVSTSKIGSSVPLPSDIQTSSLITPTPITALFISQPDLTASPSIFPQQTSDPIESSSHSNGEGALSSSTLQATIPDPILITGFSGALVSYTPAPQISDRSDDTDPQHTGVQQNSDQNPTNSGQLTGAQTLSHMPQSLLKPSGIAPLFQASWGGGGPGDDTEPSSCTQSVVVQTSVSCIESLISSTASASCKTSEYTLTGCHIGASATTYTSVVATPTSAWKEYFLTAKPNVPFSDHQAIESWLSQAGGLLNLDPLNRPLGGRYGWFCQANDGFIQAIRDNNASTMDYTPSDATFISDEVSGPINNATLAAPTQSSLGLGGGGGGTQRRSFQRISSQSNPPQELIQISTGPQYYNPSYLYDYSGGRGTTIFIIDSGLNRQHQAVQDWLNERKGDDLEPPSTLSWNQDAMTPGNDGGYDDADGHGSCIWSKAVSLEYGIAKKANVNFLKIDTHVVYKNSELVAIKYSISSFVKAMGILMNQLDTLDPRKVVVNLSLSARVEGDMVVGGKDYNMLRTFMSDLNLKGILVVMAAGNIHKDHPDQDRVDTLPQLWRWPGYPNSNYRNFPENMIIVGSSDTYSRVRHATSKLGPDAAREIDVYAPGNPITCINGQGNSGTHLDSGTSYASPQVAGVGALLMASADPPGNARDVKDKILQLAYPRVPNGEKVIWNGIQTRCLPPGQNANQKRQDNDSCVLALADDGSNTFSTIVATASHLSGPDNPDTAEPTPMTGVAGAASEASSQQPSTSTSTARSSAASSSQNEPQPTTTEVSCVKDHKGNQQLYFPKWMNKVLQDTIPTYCSFTGSHPCTSSDLCRECGDDNRCSGQQGSSEGKNNIKWGYIDEGFGDWPQSAYCEDQLRKVLECDAAGNGNLYGGNVTTHSDGKTQTLGWRVLTSWVHD